MTKKTRKIGRRARSGSKGRPPTSKVRTSRKRKELLSSGGKVRVHPENVSLDPSFEERRDSQQPAQAIQSRRMAMEIQIPKHLNLSEKEIERLTKELGGEVVDTARGTQAEAVTAVKVVEESEVVKRQVKAKVTE